MNTFSAAQRTWLAEVQANPIQARLKLCSEPNEAQGRIYTLANFITSLPSANPFSRAFLALPVTPYRRELFSLLAHMGAFTDANRTSTLLREALTAADADLVSQLIANGLDLNQRDTRGRTPLHDIFQIGSAQIVADTVRTLSSWGYACRDMTFVQGNPLSNGSLRTLTRRTDFRLVAEHLREQGLANTVMKYLEQQDTSSENALVLLSGINTPIDAEGNTALMIALMSYDEAKVEWLLSNGANASVKNSKGRNALHCAAMTPSINRDNITALLRQALPDAFHAEDNYGDTPLDIACSRENTRFVKALLKRPLPSQQDIKPYLLQQAYDNGDLDLAMTLICHGAELHPASDLAKQLFKMAYDANPKRFNIMVFLFRRGIVIPIAFQRMMRDLLHAAWVADNSSLAKLLIERGVDPIQTMLENGSGGTLSPDRERVHMGSCSVSIFDLFEYATAYGGATLQMLRSIPGLISATLCLAHQKAEDRVVNACLSLCTPTEIKETLFQACTGGQDRDLSKLIAFLVERNMLDPNCSFDTGESPTYLAYLNGKREVGDLLYRLGGKLTPSFSSLISTLITTRPTHLNGFIHLMDTVDDALEEPVMSSLFDLMMDGALDKDNLLIISMLFSRGFAISPNDKKMIRLYKTAVLEDDGNIAHCQRIGVNPISFLVTLPQQDQVSPGCVRLRSTVFDLFALYKTGTIPFQDLLRFFDMRLQESLLIRGCQEQHVEIVTRLLHAMPSLFGIMPQDTQSSLRPVLLEMLQRTESLDLAEALLLTGVKIDGKSDLARSLLLKACYERSSRSSLIGLLHESGVDISAPLDGKRTPLMIACEKNQTDVVELLILRGVDASYKDFRGRTALDLAFQHNHIDAIVLLLLQVRGIPMELIHTSPLIVRRKNLDLQEEHTITKVYAGQMEAMAAEIEMLKRQKEEAEEAVRKISADQKRLPADRKISTVKASSKTTATRSSKTSYKEFFIDLLRRSDQGVLDLNKPTVVGSEPESIARLREIAREFGASGQFDTALKEYTQQQVKKKAV